MNPSISDIVRLGVVPLSDTKPPDGPTWQQIAVVGTYQGHQAGAFTLSPAVFAEICRNYAEVDGGQVAFDFEHASELDPTSGNVPTEGAPAQGWIRKLENRGARGLWALVDWLEPARTYIRQQKYRFVSPAIRFNARHPVSGKPIGARLTSVALTNKPFLRGMVPLMAADRERIKTVSLREAVHALAAHRGVSIGEAALMVDVAMHRARRVPPAKPTLSPAALARGARILAAHRGVSVERARSIILSGLGNAPPVPPHAARRAGR